MFDRITNAINASYIEKLTAVCALLRETLRRAGRSFSKGGSEGVYDNFYERRKIAQVNTYFLSHGMMRYVH
jgi:hypothetical protein